MCDERFGRRGGFGPGFFKKILWVSKGGIGREGGGVVVGEGEGYFSDKP